MKEKKKQKLIKYLLFKFTLTCSNEHNTLAINKFDIKTQTKIKERKEKGRKK